MLVNDRVRITSEDNTNGQVGTLVAIADEEGLGYNTYRVKLDGQDVDYPHAIAFDAAELCTIGAYVVRIKLDASVRKEERYLAKPGGPMITSFAKAYRFASLVTAQAEAARYPAWREVIAVTVKRMVSRPVYALKKVAA